MTDHVFQIALLQTNKIGSTLSRRLITRLGSAENVLKASPRTYAQLSGISHVLAKEIKDTKGLARAKEEVAYCEKNGIKITSWFDSDYPTKLKQCADAPLILYSKGNWDLLNNKCLSIVGTRKASRYAQTVCEELVESLATSSPTIISGLAAGIDSCAHKSALKYKVPTVAVLAYGFEWVYPAANRNLLRNIVDEGLVITEFISTAKPDKENFPKRNRIVAGLSECTLVAESAITGGSMITARLAADYNREVIAVPGHVTEKSFEGCHELIFRNVAAIYPGPEKLKEYLGWNEDIETNSQQSLFFDLTDAQQIFYDYLKEKGASTIDNIALDLGIPHGKALSALLEMELSGIIHALPGKKFSV